MLVALQRRSAFGVTRPRKKTRDDPSVSLVLLSELRVNVSLDVPEMVVDAAESVLTFMLST